MAHDVTAGLQEAERLMNAGNLHDARKLCRAFVDEHAGIAQGWRLLGQINGNLALYDDAAACFRRAIDIAPLDSTSHFFLGLTLLGANDPSRAIAAFRRTLELQPDHGPAHARLGDALHQESRFAEAKASYEAALALGPGNALLHCNLGVALRELKSFAPALQHLQRAAQLDPNSAAIQVRLGETLFDLGQLDEAEAAFRKAVTLNPGDAHAHYLWGKALFVLRRYSEAMTSYRAALARDPDLLAASREIAAARLAMGMAGEAVDAYRQVLGRDPRQQLAHRSLLLALHYLPETSSAQLLQEHVDWAKRFVRSDSAFRPAKSRRAEHKIRVGYFSPDLRMHSVAYFLEPLVSHHDRDRFEIFFYSNTTETDAVTERLKRLAANWRDVIPMPDGEFRDTVRDDCLDILVDLAGHTEGGRPGVIGERLAPVQVSYLGYPGTTGIAAMDYRLTDEWADPAGSEAHYTERLIRLPGGFLCYSQIFAAPSAGPLPESRNGFITFGSFNNIAKLSLPAIALWARILGALPDSRLRLKAKALADTSARQHVQQLFARHGISGGRLLLDGWAPSSGEHLAQYSSVDIALDPFPYNGTTTTCEALWMGVPVVTLAGARHSGRVGASLLASAGFPEFIANSEDEYVEIARRLANDTTQLAVWRGKLRGAMQDSPLCDANRIAREIETAYRAMHARYRASCGAQTLEPDS